MVPGDFCFWRRGDGFSAACTERRTRRRKERRLGNVGADDPTLRKRHEGWAPSGAVDQRGCEENARRRHKAAPTRLWLTQVTPVVEFVGVFTPAVAEVGAVVHVGNEDIFYAGIGLGLGLFHGLAEADYDQHHARGAGDQPLLV